MDPLSMYCERIAAQSIAMDLPDAPLFRIWRWSLEMEKAPIWACFV